MRSHSILKTTGLDTLHYTSIISDKILSSLSGKNHEIKREKGDGERMYGRSLE